MRIRPYNLTLAAAVLFSCTARADIYSFVDDQGVVHYTNVPADERYLLLLAGEGSDRIDQRESARDTGLLERAAEYEPYIRAAAVSTGVEAELLRAVIVVESAFDTTAVSSAGAQGLMQLMPSTAARYGVTDPFDPEQNIRGGARYLRSLLETYDNNFELALAAYNAGEHAVERYGGAVPPFPETLAYVPRVLRVYSSLRRLARSI